MAIVPKPQFPNIPKLPGVPQLLRSSNFPASPGPVIGTAVAIGRLFQALFAKPQWGIFKQVPPAGDVTVTVGGVSVKSARPTSRSQLQPVVTPDSFLDFGYRNESEVSDYPVQDGGFTTYNKVANAYETSVRMSKAGSQSDRQKFLKSIDDILATTDLYYILTPEKQYVNVNPYRFELTRRGAQGAFALWEVDLYFREIRSVTAQYTQTAVSTQNAQQPAAAPVANAGTVNGQAAPEIPNLNAFGMVTQ